MEACVFSVGAIGFWHAVLPCPAWIVVLAWSAVCILSCVVLSRVAGRTLCALVCAGGGGFPAFSETLSSHFWHRCLSFYTVPHTSHFQIVVSFMIFSSCYRLYWHGQEDFSEKNPLTRHPSPQSSGIPHRTPSPLSRTAAGNGRPGATGDPYR